MKKRKAKYSPELAGRMYLYFVNYDDRGAPSFTKFARTVGMTTEELNKFRSRAHFNRAWQECLQIRRDYLIDRALDKRFDGSFTKFLLSTDEEMAMGEDGNELTLHLEVSD